MWLGEIKLLIQTNVVITRSGKQKHVKKSNNAVAISQRVIRNI